MSPADDSGDSGGSSASGPAAAADTAIGQLRSAAKWLIGAFAAIGTTLVAGSQLSDIGKLHGWRLFWAFLGIAIAFGGIALAIGLVVRTLVPEHLTLAGLANQSKESPANQLVAEDPAILMGHGKTIAELKEARDKALAAESSAWAAAEQAPTDAAARTKAEQAQAQRKLVDDAVQTFLSLALYADIRAKVTPALRAMFGGALAAAIGIALFAWAAHPKAKESTPAAEPAAAAVPAEVKLSLSDEGRKELADSLGADCKATDVRALAVGGEPAALDVVTIPEGACKAAHFTLTSEVGQAAPIDQVEALPPCKKESPKPPCVVR